MASAPRTTLATRIPERSSARYTATLKDENDTPLSAGALSSLTLTLSNAEDKAIINAVDHVDILNTGRGSIDLNGLLTITLAPDDNPIIDSARLLEHHVALIEWKWAGATKIGRHETVLIVQNLDKAS